MKTILISTYNSNIISELLGFINWNTVTFYENSSVMVYIKKLFIKYNLKSADELWLIATSGNIDRMEKEIRNLENFESFPLIRIWYPEGVGDINSIESANTMKELIFRLVLSAKNICGKSGQLYLSLTGGRKTMSSDLHQAAEIFGADLLFHILQKEKGSIDPDNFLPVVVDFKIKQKPYSYKINRNKYGIPFCSKDRRICISVFLNKGNESLVPEIEKLREKSENLLVNYENEHSESKRENFHKLNFLSPEIIAHLKNYRIGIDPSKKDKELAFLKAIPKPELHCHFGGTANPEELCRIAESNTEKIDYWKDLNEDFVLWSKKLYKTVSDRTIGNKEKKKIIMEEHIPDGVKSIGNLFDIEEPVIVSDFILTLAKNENFLDYFIYGELFEKDNFIGVGINNYASLGDLQGSALLQSEESIRTGCRLLAENCRKNNITYLELRISPHKYIRGGLSEKQVIDIIIDELSRASIDFRIIIIAGRDKDHSEIKHIVDMILELYKTDKEFKNKFGGIDLAGPENSGTPEELREFFIPLMEICPHITIHAGEGEAVESIWQAVYHLNADRIGHGLTLRDNLDLLKKFIDKNIAIEMCPSSNVQIVGFCDRDIVGSESYDNYPLKEYLSQGLLVTINTDDPGISMTDLSSEYYRAARLTEKGLSIWEILQIIRNGFKSVFTDYITRRKLIEEAENRIFKIIERGEFPG